MLLQEASSWWGEHIMFQFHKGFDPLSNNRVLVEKICRIFVLSSCTSIRACRS